MQIGADWEEVDGLDEALVSQIHAEIGEIQAFSELFSGDEEDELGLNGTFELFGEEEQEMAHRALKLGVAHAPQQCRVDIETAIFFARNASLTDISADCEDVRGNTFEWEGLWGCWEDALDGFRYGFCTRCWFLYYLRVLGTHRV